MQTSRKKHLELVAKCLAEVLDIDSVELTEASSAEDFEDWDSVNHVRLLISLERRLGIQFTSSEVGVVGNVGELIDLIDKRTR